LPPRAAKPALFVIAGAHGVGKTTTLAECLHIFERLGIAVSPFHHILDTRPAAAKAPPAPPAQKPLRKALWRRLAPGWAKLILISFLNEARYMRGVGGLVRRAREAGAIALADRYVYDRWVDLRIRARPAPQIIAVRLACSLMPRPRLLIRLEDEPAAIRQRKQELETPEIQRYQDDLAGLCERLGLAATTIRIDGRTPQAVAGEAVARMIEALGEEVFAFLQPGPKERAE
jgi:thymidylate kinase